MGYGPDPWTLAYWVDHYEGYDKSPAGTKDRVGTLIPLTQAAGGGAPGVDQNVARGIPAYVAALYQ